MWQGRNTDLVSYVGENIQLSDDMKSMSYMFQEYGEGDLEISRLIDTLFRFGLIQEQIDILLERFINQKSYGEITEEYHFVNARMTAYAVKKALEQLKEAGFGKHLEGIN